MCTNKRIKEFSLMRYHRLDVNMSLSVTSQSCISFPLVCVDLFVRVNENTITTIYFPLEGS